MIEKTDYLQFYNEAVNILKWLKMLLKITVKVRMVKCKSR
jgi:hypothetical protein